MTTADVRDIARRAAEAAESAGVALGLCLRDVARRMAMGEVAEALDRLDVVLPRLERFFGFLVQARDRLELEDAGTARRLDGVIGRCIDAADAVSRGLDGQDLVAVTMALELALAPACESYGELARDVTSALARGEGRTGRGSVAA